MCDSSDLKQSFKLFKILAQSEITFHFKLKVHAIVLRTYGNAQVNDLF